MAAKDLISKLRLALALYRTASAMAVLGIAASAAMFYIISDLDLRLAKADLSTRALEESAVLQNIVNDYPAAAQSVADLLSYSGDTIDFASFTSFTEALRARYLGISAFTWAPRVLLKDRAALEAKARATVVPNYQIVDNALSGNPTRAPDRDEYFPNLYYTVEPGFENVAGFDGMADPLPAALYRAAIDKGEQQSIGPIPVMRVGGKDVWGYLLFTPVYQWDLPHNTVEERRQNIRGIVVGVIRIQETLAKLAGSLGAKTSPGLYFFNPNGQFDNRLLYWWPGGASARVPQESEIRAGLHQDAILKIANSSLGMLLAPATDESPTLWSSRAPRIFLFGLMLTAILTSFAIVMTRRRLQLEDVSKELRTTASRLSFSNVLLTAATETEPDAVLVVNERNEIVLINHRFTEMMSVPPAIASAHDDAGLLAWVTSQVADEAAFVERVKHLYAHPELTSHDLVTMKDGRTLERDTTQLRDSESRYLGRIWFFRDISGRLRAEQAQQYRGDLLHALDEAATALLSASALDTSIAKALEILGKAVGASRAMVMEVPGGTGGSPILLRHAWHAPGAPVATAELITGALAACGPRIDEFFAPLREGKPIQAHRSAGGIPEPLLNSLAIASMLVVPIMIEGHYWGHIGFDDCQHERSWSPVELDILFTLSELIGATITRARHLEIITATSRDLQHSKEAQQYRGDLLHSVAAAGRALLADADLDIGIPRALALVAQAIGADQAVVIEEIEASQGALPFAFRFSWNGPGVLVGLDENAVRGCADLMPQLGKVFAPLRQGKPVNLNRAHPDGGGALLERLQVDSFIVLPITVDGAYWGQLGFNAVSRRAWSAIEIDILSTLSDLIGASITRAGHLGELAAADAIIERSPVILYRLAAKPPFPMTYVSRNVAQLGFDAGEFLRSPGAFRQMFDPEDLAHIGGHLAKLTQHWEAGGPNLWHMRRADGSHCWYENQLFPIFAGDGKLEAIEGVAVNVDERVRADAALRRYNDLLDAVTHSVATLLTESSLTEAVPRALEHVGECIGDHRVMVFQRTIDPASPHYNELRFKWTSDEEPISSFEKISPPEAKVEVVAWFAPLGEGKIVSATKETASGTIKKIMEQIGATSLLLVPIFVDGVWWGHISFEGSSARRSWEETEIALFRTLANLIGAAIARERRLQELADANRIVENSPTLLYRALAEPNLPFVYISQNVKRFGFTAEQLLADPSHIRRIHPDDSERVWEWNQAICSGAQTSATIEFRIQLPDGSYRWVENHGQAIKDETGRVVAVEGILVDIHEHKKAEETIAALARTDALTGLANRRTFLERLEQAFGATKRGASRFAVLSLDLDHFKEINDTLGHPMGDLLLQGVATRLRSAVRETDVVARFGGDEFMVLQADVDDPAAAGTLAEKIRAMIAAPLLIEGNTLHVTASIGIITYAPEIADGETMIAQADIALYRAKEEGRDRYRFHSDEMNSDVRERMALVEELHEGLTRQEFELHYQPLVELATARVVGMEALLRWNHPRRGRLLPGVFLPAAERAGLIVPLGHWIFEEACRQLRTWRQAGLASLPMTINVSVAQLKSGDLFARDLEKILQKYDIEPKNIELDIRERVLGGMTQAQITALQELHKLGVRLAIDDFGGELSSLGYVQKYNVSHLKISRSVVQMAVNDSGSAAAVKAINDFAVDLGVGVVVEGVETKDQRAVLMSIAPHTTAQGFLFSRPLDAAAATEILRGDGLGTETPDAGFASLQQGAA